MKRLYRPVLLSLIFGLLVWIGDAFIDYLYYYESNFLDLLIFNPPGHELYVRTLIIFSFLIFGVIISFYNYYLQRERQKYSTIVKSIGDAVIATDRSGKILEMNKIAEQLTGWKIQEARGESLEKVFKIVNSKTREKVRNPVEKVLEKKNIVGLANHTLLISKDGTEYQIADSGSPIKNEAGDITGVVLVFRDVTEEYSLHKKIRENEKRLKEAQKLGKMGSWEINLDTGQVTASKEAYKIYGIDPDKKLTLETVKAIPLSEYRNKLDKALENLIQGKNKYDVHFKIQRVNDNQIRDIHSVAKYEPAKNNIIGTIHDITPLKEAERKLRNSEHKYRALFNSIRDAILVADTDRNIINCNPAFTNLFGYSLAEIEGKKTQFVYKDYQEYRDMGAKISEHIDSEENFIFTIQYRKKSGQVFPGETNVFYLKSDTGEITGFIGLIRDISERLAAEEKLRKNEAMLSRTEKIANVGSWEWDVATDTTIWSDELFRIFKLDPEQGAPSFAEHHKLYHSDDMQKLNHAVEKALKDGSSYTLELRAIRTDGEIRYCEAQGHPETDPNGEVVRLYGFLQDITERKEIEKKLRKAHSDLEQILNATLPLCAISKDFKMIKVNDTFCSYFQVDKNDIIGKNCYEIWDRPFCDSADCTLKQILNGRQHTKFEITKNVNSKELSFIVTAIPYLDPQGEIIGVIETFTDITERKVAEQELNRVNNEIIEKNKSLEQLLYATSHDLRSPLINIQGFNKELQRSFGELKDFIETADLSQSLKEDILSLIEEDISESLHYILSSTSKMDELLTGLLTLSRLGRKKLDIKKLNMNRLIEKVIENFEYEIKDKNVELRISELPDCKGDPLQINQIFSNLLSNALKNLAPDRDGKIQISGKNINSHSLYQVKDNGVGIPHHQQKKIFNLFHKLDPQKPGIGLGLNIIKQIIDKHGGEIRVESEKDQGSKFSVILPAPENNSQ